MALADARKTDSPHAQLQQLGRWDSVCGESSLRRGKRSLVTGFALCQNRGMPRVATTKRSSATTSLCFEATLWAVANKLRGNFDAAEYKYVVLGLIFLKSICAAFEEKHAAPNVEEARTGANPQDRDE